MVDYIYSSSRKSDLPELPSIRSARGRDPEVGQKQLQRHLVRLFQNLQAGIYPQISIFKTKYIWRGFAGSTLVESKDQAREFLRVHQPWIFDCSPSRFQNPSTGLETYIDLHHSADMAAVETARRGSTRPSPIVGGPISGMIHRPSLAENVRTASANSVSSTGGGPGLVSGMEEKPIASGNGVSLSIALAEPVLFLQGFDQSELGNQNTTMLRGSFHLRVSKAAKIKTISLAFRGRAETEWPEGSFV